MKIENQYLKQQQQSELKMRKRINFQLLKQCQQRVQKNQEQQNTIKLSQHNVNYNNLQQQLYHASYELINDLLCDIKRPFKNICIHGYHTNQAIDYIAMHYQLNNNTATNKSGQSVGQNKDTKPISTQTLDQKPKLTIIDYLDLVESPSTSNNYINDNFQISVTKLENSDSFIAQEQQFDLIISSLELNHCNNEEKLLEKYLRTLKPDGALIGCAMVEGTLSELHWSYLMAENQRYGGLSPKVISFPSLGQLGNLLTQAHYHLATVLNRDYHLQLQSPLQVVKMIQLLGENMHLKGRRKGVYKELLVAMYAMYQSEFSFDGQVVRKMLKAYEEGNSAVIVNDRNKQATHRKENSISSQNTVLATLVLSPFVGWKYSPNQPKPLQRGQHGNSIDFVDQLRKYDPDLQHFTITQQSNQPQQVKPKSSETNIHNDKNNSHNQQQAK